jgi:hypothetical protein
LGLYTIILSREAQVANDAMQCNANCIIIIILVVKTQHNIEAIKVPTNPTYLISRENCRKSAKWILGMILLNSEGERIYVLGILLEVGVRM